MFTKQFVSDALERAIKTFAQFLTTLVGVAYLSNPNQLLEINWGQIILIALIGAGLSILTSLASTLKGDSNSASLVK